MEPDKVHELHFGLGWHPRLLRELQATFMCCTLLFRRGTLPGMETILSSNEKPSFDPRSAHYLELHSLSSSLDIASTQGVSLDKTVISSTTDYA